MRVELPEGQWVELRERITHGQNKDIRRARVRARDNPEEATGEAETVAMRIFVRAWNVKDVDGTNLPLEDADAMDRLPSDIADALLGPIATVLQGATEPPNSPTPPSSDA